MLALEGTQGSTLVAHAPDVHRGTIVTAGYSPLPKTHARYICRVGGGHSQQVKPVLLEGIQGGSLSEGLTTFLTAPQVVPYQEYIRDLLCTLDLTYINKAWVGCAAGGLIAGLGRRAVNHSLDYNYPLCITHMVSTCCKRPTVKASATDATEQSALQRQHRLTRGPSTPHPRPSPGT